MQIEIAVPDGADLIERDAYARGAKEGAKMRAGVLCATAFLGALTGFVAALLILH